MAEPEDDFAESFGWETDPEKKIVPQEKSISNGYWINNKPLSEVSSEEFIAWLQSVVPSKEWKSSTFKTQAAKIQIIENIAKNYNFLLGISKWDFNILKKGVIDE